MTTLIEFLRARIAEDEEAASTAAESGETRGTFDPERVLLECQIKRQIVDYAQLTPDPHTTESPKLDDDAGWALKNVLGYMAGAWPNHRHYNPAWRP